MLHTKTQKNMAVRCWVNYHYSYHPKSPRNRVFCALDSPEKTQFCTHLGFWQHFEKQIDNRARRPIAFPQQKRAADKEVFAGCLSSVLKNLLQSFRDRIRKMLLQSNDHLFLFLWGEMGIGGLSLHLIRARTLLLLIFDRMLCLVFILKLRTKQTQ